MSLHSSISRALLARPRAALSGLPRVLVYPAMENEEELLDLFFKAAFYLPRGSIRELVIPYTFSPALDLSDRASWPRPSCAGEYEVGGRPDIVIRRVRLGPGWRDACCADLVLSWRRRDVENMASRSGNEGRFLNVDRHNNPADGWDWASFMFERLSGERRTELREESRGRFAGYLDGLPTFRRCYVFGTGPSLEDAWKHRFDDGYRIVCNTIVNNPALLDHIRPHVIVAGDAIYHFGHNRHAVAFRKDLVHEILKHRMMFVMRDSFVPLFLHHHPEVAEFTVAAETGAKGLFLDARQRIVYHQWPQGNILNALMLPLGTSLADEVFFLGFDGRAPGEKQFWQNAATSSYSALKPAIESAHPAFFKINYEAYAQAHSDFADQIMQAGEAMGKRYVCLNESYVPAFRKRIGVCRA